MDGDTVKFYQVIEWVGDAAGNVAGWKAVDAYKSVLTETVLKEMLVGDSTQTPAVAPVGMTTEIAGKLAALAANGADATSISGGTATYNNASSGMWMALVTPADANTVYNPVFVSADYNKETGHTGTAAVTGQYAEGVAKKSTVTLSKTADDKLNNHKDEKAGTVAVGDTIEFTVTTTIPAFGEVYESPKFDVTDNLNGLELVGDSITVTGEGVAAANYTITPASYDKADTYTIAFDPEYLKTVKAATDITIVYQAKVTEEASDAINQKDNEVTIKYSHDPNNQSDYAVKKDTTQHYTFTLDASAIGGGDKTSQKGTKTSELVKVGVDAEGKPLTQKTETSTIEDGTKETWTSPLEGAQFGLYSASTCKEEELVKSTSTTADGRMTFDGLDQGTYYLKEIKAPDGFVTSTDVYTIVIAAEIESVKVTETVEGKEVSYDTDVLKSYTVTITDPEGNSVEAAKYTFTNTKTATDNDIQWTVMECVEHPFPINNTKGTELPSTGGMGTTILYVAGSILVLGAAVIMITRRRVRG
jgi:LPXTG-motif cell wall-anchored protein